MAGGEIEDGARTAGGQALRVRRWTLFALTVWTLLIAVSMAMSYQSYLRVRNEQALATARAATGSDLVVQRWIAGLGGVYAPVSDRVPPSPHLAHLSERDVVTPSGQRLTLLNAAYALRLAHEAEVPKDSGRSVRFTSPKPLRAENAPDAWERRALEHLSREQGEFFEFIERGDGGPVMRRIEAMWVEESCLKCHGEQGYTVGDLRGAYSTTISLTHLQTTHRESIIIGLVAQIAVWALGLVGLLLGSRTIRARLRASEREAQGVRQRAADRERGAAALAESELRFRTLFETAVEGILVADSDTRRFISCNAAACELLGYPLEELLELGVGDIHPEEALPEVQAAFERQTRGELRLAPGLPCLRKDGSLIYVNITAAQAVIGGRGCTIGFFTDVTESRHLETKLRQSNRLEAVGTLAGGVAHDFNNILQAILGHTELLLRDPMLHPDHRADAEAIGEAAQRAADLTRQLLAYSRRQVIATAPLQLAELCDGLLTMLGRLIPGHIQLEVTHRDGDSRVLADSGQLEQVVMNLCVNARDALPEGGTISIETRRGLLEAADAGRHPDARPGSFVCLTVTDDGLGMDASTLEQIFEPFFTTKGLGGGTGLGLATVYGIIRQHEGWIEVESELGQGTRYTIFLPSTELTIDHASETPSVSPGGGTEVILLAEDEPAVLRPTQRLLEQAGYTVLAAPDGVAALRLLEEEGARVDLAILDVVMPGRTGREVADWMGEHRPLVPVLFISGYSADQVHTRFVLEAGWRFVQKPIATEELLLAVRELLDARASSGTAKV